MTKETFHGSCHCGAVTFTADIDFDQPSQRCNCSICRKTRTWFIGIPAADLTITKGQDALADYSWTPPGKPPLGLHYYFCKTCGVRAFARGQEKSLGGPFYAVAIAALDDVAGHVDQITGAIRYVDGAHDEYRTPPADIRMMR